MQECKDRDPRPLEWKDGEGDLLNSFEKWAKSEGLDIRMDAYDDFMSEKTTSALSGWNARYSEIDALKAENERLRQVASEAIAAIGSAIDGRDVCFDAVIENLAAALNKGES
jgi:hypothetical protein